MEKRLLTIIATFLLCCTSALAQVTIKGDVFDNTFNEALIGANVIIEGTTTGTVTDWDGSFVLKAKDASLPLNLVVTYLGYTNEIVPVTSTDEKIRITLSEDAIVTEVVEVKGQRISEKQKSAPLTVESMDLLAIKETPAENFYDGLGSLKGVDLTAASLGFKVINTRGFNSTSPVRSLQIIDGVDNQAPGLNFSLGNFLGSSELDVLKVDLIQGASSAYYGPNAFNGVISMETKNPFYQKGLSAKIKVGERSLMEGAFRYADDIKNKDGLPWMAYKINFFALRANDWEATNDAQVDSTESMFGNPGGWDQVNTYGDEYIRAGDFSDPVNLGSNRAGLGTYHRTGYQERDLVDYNTKNIKANLALHFRTNPAAEYESPELIISSSFGTGTTVYQGDNRFSLKDLLFFQNRIEFRKKDKFFIRAYATNEDAGNSYDPYFTALRLQESSKSNEDWANDYALQWRNEIYPRMVAMEFPLPSVNSMGQLVFDRVAADEWLARNQDSLTIWHSQTAAVANLLNPTINGTQDYFEPGTERFQNAFDSITALNNTEGGTRFYDKSALYHIAGEYQFETPFLDEIKVGANFRHYRPVSAGTVFKDTADIVITNSEVGFYAGLTKKFGRQLILTGTFRVDKNQNFDVLFTPAASVVYSPDPFNFLRFSFSSGVRNPTLSDQYLNFDVGRATLLGNLDGFNDLVTVESLQDYFASNFQIPLDSFSIAPVKPEKVKTFEIGYRTSLFESLYIDASYYYSIYDDFIGYNIGVQATIPQGFTFPTNIEVYRVSANSINTVTTQGFAIGLNYYFAKYFGLSGNYSWNKLNKTFSDDPIIPAFNTPEHKFNLGISARNMPLNLGFAKLQSTGFSINYKWIQGFLFEGSPQFTGFVDDYSLLDAQVNATFKKLNLTVKLGASNLLNTKSPQTYGGPRIGRLAYLSLLYDFVKK